MIWSGPSLIPLDNIDFGVKTYNIYPQRGFHTSVRLHVHKFKYPAIEQSSDSQWKIEIDVQFLTILNVFYLVSLDGQFLYSVITAVSMSPYVDTITLDKDKTAS